MVSLLWYLSVFAAQDRFPLPQEDAFRKQGLTQRGAFLGVGALKAECLNRGLEAASGGGESMRGDRTPGLFENKSMSLRMHFKPIFSIFYNPNFK